MSDRTVDLDVRTATDDDHDAVLDLLQASLGWVPDDQYGRFFAWKHHESPFGRSPAWVALDGDRIVGFRTFMRWEFERDGAPVRAVRAVDTATHPEYQGRGIFTLLTRRALEDLRADGVAFVFNTPNEKSRPGYLKMGWQLVGRLPVAARPRSLPSLLRVARARTAADKWSAPTEAGEPIEAALADRSAVERLLARSTETTDGGGGGGDAGPLRTRRSVEYLAWRYGFGPLRYRALPVSGPSGDGLVVFRLRRRGGALEAAVCEELMPPDDAKLRRRAHRELLRSTGADHAVVIGAPRPTEGLLPVPGQGPTLVWRDVGETSTGNEVPRADRWLLNLGDVELF
jgi:GNAT superfamily N-acetyltransferase